MESTLSNARLEPVWNTNKKIIFLFATLTLFLLVFPLFGPNSFYLHLMIMIFMYAVMAQSWNVIAGLSGQISLGHAVFFGIGAYTSSFLYVQYGVTPWIGIFIGMIFFRRGCSIDWNSDVATKRALFCDCNLVDRDQFSGCFPAMGNGRRSIGVMDSAHGGEFLDGPSVS